MLRPIRSVLPHNNSHKKLSLPMNLGRLKDLRYDYIQTTTDVANNYSLNC